MKRLTAVLICCILFMMLNNEGYSQLSISAQLRTRAEFRDGQGAPLVKGLKPGLFTSQRTRLMTGFTLHRLTLGISLQDVRVWGQDVSTINRTTAADNNGLMFHESWAQIQLTDTTIKNKSLNLKIGRQELAYDDQRLIGNLDWLQQGRRHDAAVLKFENAKWTLHLGGAFNQDREKNSGTIYSSVYPGNYTATTNGGTMYKSMEFLYAGKKIDKGNISFLFFSDQFNSYRIDSSNGNIQKVFTEKSWSRATAGFFINKEIDDLSVTASAYHQFGKNAEGGKSGGQLLTLSTQYVFGKFSIGTGADYTSADFDPLYGTPHKFWGLMDYFYAASGTGNYGLVDYFIRSKWKASQKLSFSADCHHFNSAIGIPGHSRIYGQEIDVVGNYTFTQLINFEAGFGHFFATDALAFSKNIANSRRGANWAYVMVNIRPEFLFK